ncbi:glycogen/starch/alpha-glucan phosphorylase, partial [Anaeromusa sp.]
MKSDLEQQSSKEIFRKNFVTRVQSLYGKSIDEALPSEKYMALGMVVRDYISSNWIQTNQQYSDRGEKQVYYFSIEFLLGRLMELNLINLGIRDVCEAALKEAGTDLQELLEVERDAGLGNGGLGRLAACFLDSLAAMGLPGHGNGIRYRYGLFEQKIVDNYQVELPDHWLKDRYVWEYRKADKAVTVRFGGRIEMIEQDGHMRVVHQDAQAVLAVPYDVPVIGYDNNTVNTLRLWNAEPLQSEFDLTSFNRGDYLQAVQYQQQVEAISKILYPEDTFYEGRLLRLKQQYFFVCAGLQSILRRFKRKYLDLHLLPDKVAVHINDTHPAVAIPELMRLLMDEEGMGWNEAWDITIRTVSYTNHTILPEALESWPVDMFATLLPRV